MSLEKISFNGEKISVRRAKTIYSLMKIGLYNPELDDKEKMAYLEWFQKNRGEEKINLKPRGKPLMVPVNERGYLTMNLYFELITRGFLKSLGKYDKKYGELKRNKPIPNNTFDPVDYI
ncbi:MAG: hypothetical protein ACP5NZ_04790 [Nanobdellota archaeon]